MPLPSQHRRPFASLVGKASEWLASIPLPDRQHAPGSPSHRYGWRDAMQVAGRLLLYSSHQAGQEVSCTLRHTPFNSCSTTEAPLFVYSVRSLSFISDKGSISLPAHESVTAEAIFLTP